MYSFYQLPFFDSDQSCTSMKTTPKVEIKPKFSLNSYSGAADQLHPGSSDSILPLAALQQIRIEIGKNFGKSTVWGWSESIGLPREKRERTEERRRAGEAGKLLKGTIFPVEKQKK